VQAFAKLLHASLAASEVELRALQLLLQLRVLLKVVLQDVIELLDLQPFEGIEYLLQLLHVVLVATQTDLYLRLVLDAPQSSSLDLVGVLHPLPQLAHRLLQGFTLAHKG
jgi:hypothetical protein